MDGIVRLYRASPALPLTLRPMTDNSPASAAARCADCGGPLLDGTCAVCAFGWMRSESASLTGAEAAGATVGRYQLLEMIARGGMGVVYAARDPELHRTVALKVLRGAMFAGAGEIGRFTLETKAAAALDHPHIVPVYEVGQEEGEPFFTMKLIDGETLADRLRAKGPMPARQAAALLVPVARAVDYAHRQGVLHRDLKPGNILVDSAGKPWLTDFGLAKFSAADSGLTRSTDTLGTPHYMSPEMAAGRAHEFTAASDVWALGVMLWEMIAGAPPFSGQSPVEILQAVVQEEVPVPPEPLRQHRDLLTIAQRCMEKRPAARIASAAIVADELERFLRGEPIQARRVAPAEKLVKWMRRRPLHAALLALGVLFLTVSSVLWLRAAKSNAALTTSNDDLALTNVRLADSLRRARAAQLAGEARLQVEENPDRALLLAAAAVEMPAGGRPLPDAVAALFEVMQQAGGTDCSPVPANADSAADFSIPRGHFDHAGQISPDSRWLVVVTATEYYLGTRPLAAALYDLKSPDRSAPVRRWSLANTGTRAHFAPLVCWMGNSQQLILVDGDKAVHLMEPLAGLPSATADAAVLTDTPPSRLLGILTPPEEMEEPTLHILQMAPPGGEREAATHMALCWRTGAQYGLQAWEAGPGGLALRGSVQMPEFRGMSERAIMELSPRGRWLLFRESTSMPLSGDGTFALLCDYQQLSRPPLRLLTDSAAAAEQTDASLMLLGSSWLRTAFGSARETEDFLVVPHPGHGLHIHELPGKAPGDAVPGTALPVHPSTLMGFALSPDARTVAESREAHGVIVHRLTLPEEGALTHSDAAEIVHLPGSEDGPVVAFSPDSQWLFVSKKQQVQYWNRDELSDGQQPQRLLGSAGRISRISLSPDSRTLFTTGIGWDMRRWNFDALTPGTNPREIATPGERVHEVAISPDGEWVAAACEGSRSLRRDHPEKDGWITAGRTGSRALTGLAVHGNMATSVAFSREGKWVAGVGGSRIRAWDFPAVSAAIDAGLPVPQRVLSYGHESILPQYDAKLAWFPGGKLYCVHGRGGDLQWDLTAPDPGSTTLASKVSSILYQLPAVALSPDGRFKAIARHGWDQDQPRPGSPQHGNQVLLYEGGLEQHGKFLHALQAHFVERTSLAFSADGRWLAAGGQGSPPTLWDLLAPDIAASRRTAPVSGGLASAVAFSPDGRRLAIGTGSNNGGAGTLNFWDFHNPDPATSVITVRTPRAILTMAWHPDGRLFTGGGGASVSVWETDLATLVRMARNAAGRDLSAVERARHGL